MEVMAGDIVKSIAGRDSGRYFIIWEVLDSSYVTIVDGDLRKIDNPKRKKVKHLKATGVRVGSHSGTYKRNLKEANADIRKLIASHASGTEAVKTAD